jgi:hypothetical protein
MDFSEREESIFYTPGALATLANENALGDLKRFLSSLQLWNTVLPPLYLLCTKAVEFRLNSLKVETGYKGEIHVSTDLETHANFSRRDMEQLPSRRGYPNLFYDFTAKKTELVSWALESQKGQNNGVLFCDSDIFWLAPLPTIPSKATMAVSPHRIRPFDEAKFGTYNAGFFWTNDPEIPILWKNAIKTSRFFEQACIEDLVDQFQENTYIFGSECNYGWWRMFQAPVSAEEKQKEWSFFRSTSHSGILVNRVPLVCIHTHFDEKNDRPTMNFNEYVIEKLKILGNSKQIKVKQILKMIR